MSLEYESEVQHVDLLRWLTSFGKEPLRREAPMLREILVVKNLHAAKRRLAGAKLAADEHHRVVGIMKSAVERAEEQLRSRIHPHITSALDEVGLTAQNVPERVARQKLVSELLDRLVEHGFLNTGVLRDSLSKGDLKLPDVAGWRELFLGDRLLRADRKLAQKLPGIYRPAPVYIRWSQRISSLGFGTPWGRQATLFFFLPFGAAFLLIEFIKHAAHLVVGLYEAGVAGGLAESAEASEAVATHAGFDWRFLAYEAALGLFFALLIHSPRFRSACWTGMHHVGRWLYRLLVHLPWRILHLPWVQTLLHSPAYAAVRNYLLKPAAVSLFVHVLTWPIYGGLSWNWTAHIMMGTALFLNSPIGRYADEWITDLFVRALEELRARFVVALIQWVMDIFQRLLASLSRVLHSLDEWSRFRVRDRRSVKFVKFIGGLVWSVVSYFIIMAFTLFIEPQINPIKHFPVVTVSHKIILPFGFPLVALVEPFLGTAWANLVIWLTIWLIPGVFGFLVWELKENWRLYAANRPRDLKPVPIAHHGETMVGLLRPSFHSGTVPRKFARLRRAQQQVRQVSHWKSAHRQQADLEHIAVAVERFVARDLLQLLRESDVLHRLDLSLQEVHLATNQIEALLIRGRRDDQWLRITWRERAGVLTATVEDQGVIDALTLEDRAALQYAIEGLCQRSGVDRMQGEVPAPDHPIAWSEWVDRWDG